MVVVIIEVENLTFPRVDAERDPPVAGYRKAPGSLSVARELMRFSARDVVKFLSVFHFLQEGQNITDLLHDSRSQAGRIIALNEAPQSPFLRKLFLFSDQFFHTFWRHGL
jgi:hypothetical protein